MCLGNEPTTILSCPKSDLFMCNHTQDSACVNCLETHKFCSVKALQHEYVLSILVELTTLKLPEY